MAAIEDLLEEMNDKAGQSNVSYFPFPLKVFTLCTEYLLVNSPRIPWYDFKINNSNFNVFFHRKKRVFVLYIYMGI